MFNEFKKSIEWGGDTLTIETGKVARQADASVIATYGETSVLCAVVYEKQPKKGFDFFPLTVHYQEKYYAAGKIPGGFFKREARPTEKETLTSRLIDRPIRPLFVPGFKHETQVICTVLSHDLENDPDVVAMIAASAALTLSGAPFMGPIGCARVGYSNGEYQLNPSVDDMHKLRENPEQHLDLVVANESAPPRYVSFSAVHSTLTNQRPLAYDLTPARVTSLKLNGSLTGIAAVRLGASTSLSPNRFIDWYASNDGGASSRR
jgi:polyribonucleotide nucleotidyltransferase